MTVRSDNDFCCLNRAVDRKSLEFKRMSQKIILIAILLIAGISALRINHQNLAEQLPAGLIEKIKEFYGSGFFSAFASQPDSEDEEPTAPASHEGVAENVKEHVAKAVEAAKKHPEVVK